MITLRAKRDVAGLEQAFAALGLTLPDPRRIVIAGEKAAGWMSPDEYLLIVPSAAVNDALASLATSLAGQHHLAANVSDARAVFRIEGDKADQVIKKISPVDVDAMAEGELRRSRAAQVAAAQAALKAAQTGVDKIQLTAANKASAEQVLAQSWAQAQAQAEAAQAAIDQAQQTLTSLANDNSTQALATTAAAQAALSAATTQLSSAQANSAALADNAAAKASAEGAVAQAQALQAGLVDNAQAALSRAQEVLAGLPSTASATEPWRRAGQSLGDPRLDALAYAILAPNPHNRQPWTV
jgi:heterotetrameric sarcosine oxidase gamma subunit